MQRIIYWALGVILALSAFLGQPPALPQWDLVIDSITANCDGTGTVTFHGNNVGFELRLFDQHLGQGNGFVQSDPLIFTDVPAGASSPYNYSLDLSQWGGGPHYRVDAFDKDGGDTLHTKSPSLNCGSDATSTPTGTSAPTSTGTNTQNPSQTPSNTVAPSQTPSATPTPSQIPSNTPTLAPSETNTAAPSATPTQTHTQEPTATETRTNEPSGTPTTTENPVISATPSATNTPGNTETPSDTSTATETALASETPTFLPSSTQTATRTPEASQTQVENTSTATQTPLASPTSTPIASVTPTNTPLPTETGTPTTTVVPTPTGTVTPTETPVNHTFTPPTGVSSCDGAIITNNANVGISVILYLNGSEIWRGNIGVFQTVGVGWNEILSTSGTATADWTDNQGRSGSIGLGTFGPCVDLTPIATPSVRVKDEGTAADGYAVPVGQIVYPSLGLNISIANGSVWSDGTFHHVLSVAGAVSDNDFGIHQSFAPILYQSKPGDRLLIDNAPYVVAQVMIVTDKNDRIMSDLLDNWTTIVTCTPDGWVDNLVLLLRPLSPAEKWLETE